MGGTTPDSKTELVIIIITVTIIGRNLRARPQSNKLVETLIEVFVPITPVFINTFVLCRVVVRHTQRLVTIKK